LGHELAGTVQQAGAGAFDGQGQPLLPGTRVAVDPAHACGRCEWCRRGDPNLCPQIDFLGLAPHAGALRTWLHVPAEDCFPVPDDIDATTATLLEPLGVALHALDLAKLRRGENVAVVGTGPIGLCILRLLTSGWAGLVYAADPLPWRADRAARYGATAAFCNRSSDVVAEVTRATDGRGVDVAIEAASGGSALQQAAEMLAPGGRLIVVGIDAEDRFVLRHSTARRKGLTIRLVRRMKHTYPRAIRLVQQQAIEWNDLVSHRFPLSEAPEAFALNADYRDEVVKVMIDVAPGGQSLSP
jgi:L-iditol 2-dehydrogenase